MRFSLRISAYCFKKLFKTLCSFLVSQAGLRYMFPSMVLNDFVKQPVYRPTGCGNQMQCLCAIGFAIQRTFDCLDLTSDTLHALEQFILRRLSVRHTIPP
ncbi:hypothetical protein BLX42_25300 [Pseudomonas sp. SG-MS2]|uniref:Uncharacterized protein n=1 Tax=Pseudomonas putida S13.1.2 TaxID=1384061 RepID=A0AAU8S9B0_PSEPU|nr:hypothetical protein N805_22480 [Pseudomonas putida S13.1.2]KAF1305590.1 hypothetical protein BLX42_25300 [Pseudomonas sp. SG-MS2]